MLVGEIGNGYGLTGIYGARVTTMAKGSDAGAERFHKREQREQDYKDQLPGEDEKKLPQPVDPIQVGEKPSRNDPCTCGSGLKYKKCCGQTKR